MNCELPLELLFLHYPALGSFVVTDNFFPISSASSAWIPNTDLKPLTPEECKDIPEKGKSKSLLSAFSVAAEGHDLPHLKSLLAEHQRALQAEIDEKEAQAAAKAAAKAEKDAKKKNKRKSTDAGENGDVDVDDADGKGKTPKSSKKRKKSGDEADADSDKVGFSFSSHRT